jgi:hypothetical protein
MIHGFADSVFFGVGGHGILLHGQGAAKRRGAKAWAPWLAMLGAKSQAESHHKAETMACP